MPMYPKTWAQEHELELEFGKMLIMNIRCRLLIGKLFHTRMIIYILLSLGQLATWTLSTLYNTELLDLTK